jgi:hypothetical protein
MKDIKHHENKIYIIHHQIIDSEQKATAQITL